MYIYIYIYTCAFLFLSLFAAIAIFDCNSYLWHSFWHRRQASTLAGPGARPYNSERHFGYSERHAATPIFWRSFWRSFWHRPQASTLAGPGAKP